MDKRFNPYGTTNYGKRLILSVDENFYDVDMARNVSEYLSEQLEYNIIIIPALKWTKVIE